MTEPFGLRATVGASALEPRLSNGLRSWPILDSVGVEIARVHGLLIEGCAGDGISIFDGKIFINRPVDNTGIFERHAVEKLNGLLLFETLGHPLGRRLYMDCGGTIPIVYCPENRSIGGSADALFDDAEYRRRLLPERVHKLVTAQGSGGWITGTLTAHEGVSRLLPNHYLDLESFTAHRFWPRTELLAAPMRELEDVAQSISGYLAAYTEAAAHQMRIAISLSAGLDSRLVLAASRNVKDRISCFTLQTSGELSYDREIPPKLCATLGIAHQSIPIIESTVEEKRIWNRMTGDALHSYNREIYTSLKKLDCDAILSGIQGEIGRCFLYTHDWTTIDRVAADVGNIAARLKQPRDTDLEDNLAEWFAPISHFPRSTVLDLAYLELRMGSWGMGQGPIQKTFSWSLAPFTQWPIQEACLKLDLQARGTGALFPRMLQILWPETLALPINKFGDWRDRLGPLNKLVRVRGKATALNYLRKRFAS